LFFLSKNPREIFLVFFLRFKLFFQFPSGLVPEWECKHRRADWITQAFTKQKSETFSDFDFTISKSGLSFFE
jgi:hypothetical protein